MAQANAHHWQQECERLTEENMILRLFKPSPPKRKPSSKSKSDKAKLEKLKTRIADLEDDNEMFEETISDLAKELEELRKKKFSSARGDPESIIQSFIDDCYISS
jgi:predicted RNase H-like nuclease (RuvC/YqgF family)